jgi:ribosomal protein S18 acetylase RimI-like enzyme
MGGPAEPLSYFKRFKMEADLAAFPPPTLPAGCTWIPWEPALLDVHAHVLYLSFVEEIDAVVFRSFGHPQGCRALMTELCRKPGFLPAATWLIADASGPVGTVQGLRDRTGLGAIQNLGVVPSHRACGLGEALLLQALQGFRQSGLTRGMLEVTAQNDGAVRLYHRLGFRRRKTVYKVVERTVQSVEC